MKVIKYIIIIIGLQLFLPICAHNLLPYVVYNATKGVVLKSPCRSENFYPVRGTKLYERDYFLLGDDRYVVKIKDVKSGEIFTWNKGKGIVTPLQIVSLQKYTLYDQFLDFLKSLAEETGFETAPICTSQGVTVKGNGESKEKRDSLSVIIAHQIRDALSDSICVNDVFVNKVYSLDSTFFYSVENRSSVNYGMVLYTVTKNCIYKHDDIIVYEMGRPSPDNIECLRLVPNHTLNLDYFSMVTDGENERTCYVLLFNPSDFYKKRDNETFDFLIDWEIVSKELKYQGDVSRVIYLSR